VEGFSALTVLTDHVRIYKDKYHDSGEITRNRTPLASATLREEKKAVDRSRTRSIFGRKKTIH
jgi:hypothetical protein